MTSERCVWLGNLKCNQNTNALVCLLIMQRPDVCGTEELCALEADLEDLRFALFDAPCGVKSCTFFLF